MDAQQVKLIEKVNEGILKVAEAEERKLDEKLSRLEDLGESFIR